MLPGMPPTRTPDPAARTADDIPIPALLRAARGAQAIQRRLVADGFDHLPRNAPFVLGGMVNQGIAAGHLLPQLGVTKQAASQLVDTFVMRAGLVALIDVREELEESQILGS